MYVLPKGIHYLQLEASTCANAEFQEKLRFPAALRGPDGPGVLPAGLHWVDVQVSQPELDCGVHSQAHEQAAGPCSVGEGLRPREGHEALGRTQGQSADPLPAVPLPECGHSLRLVGKIQKQKDRTMRSRQCRAEGACEPAGFEERGSSEVEPSP